MWSHTGRHKLRWEDESGSVSLSLLQDCLLHDLKVNNKRQGHGTRLALLAFDKAESLGYSRVRVVPAQTYEARKFWHKFHIPKVGGFISLPYYEQGPIMTTEVAESRIRRKALSDDWWNNLTKKQQQAYIKKHPNSRFARRARRNVERPAAKVQRLRESRAPIRKMTRQKPRPLPAGPSIRERVTEKLSKAKDTAAEYLGQSIIGQSGSGLKKLVTGKKMTGEEKSALLKVAFTALTVAGIGALLYATDGNLALAQELKERAQDIFDSYLAIHLDNLAAGAEIVAAEVNDLDDWILFVADWLQEHVAKG